MSSGGSGTARRLPGLWRHLPVGWRAVALGAIVLALAGWLASAVTRDATFSISARSEVVLLEVGCARPLTWDLPAGTVLAAGDPVRSVRSGRISVEMRPGTQVRVALVDGRWQIDFERSDRMGCGPPAPDALVFTVGAQAWPVQAERYRYRSDDPIDRVRQAPWLLNGRVVIGEEIQFGIGQAEASASPMLTRARIDVRTPDAQTAQRRQIHEEQVDAGGIVDSHGCLDAPLDRLPGCLQAAGSLAEGFVYVGGEDGPRGFDVQLLVSGERIGVRQQAGAERRVVVTWWSRVVTSSWVQIAAALLAALGAVGSLWPLLEAGRTSKEEGA